MSKGVKLAVSGLTAVMTVTFSVGLFVADGLAADVKNGEKIFKANCVVCHGEKGDGKGPASAGMTPPPRNFTSDAEMKGIDDARLHKSITEGRPGTPMVGFGKTLKPSDIDDVIAYIKTFRKK